MNPRPSPATIALSLFLLLPITALPRAFRYSEDLQTRTLAAHSTFHYELTRTLARAAGFTAPEAESLAVICAAIDVETFTGETGITIAINGTKRASATGQYWHFARRDSNNVTDEFTYPGARNTCAYFTTPIRSCPGGTPELDQIESWAIHGTASPTTGVPQISLDGGASFQEVKSKTLTALAFFLHALADSYSHEACMAAAQVRTHKPNPPECSAISWHIKAEYGNDPNVDNGVPYTEEAAEATWMVLNWYRQHLGLTPPALWSEEQAHGFIQKWVRLDRPQDRHDFAAKAFEALP